MNLRSTAPMVVCPPGGDPAMMALTVTEQKSHQAGWGKPLALHLMHRVAVDRVAVTGQIDWGSAGRMDPMRFLSLLMRGMGMLDPRVTGFVLIVEETARYYLADEVDRLGDAAERHTSDVRNAFLATVGGRDIHLTRYRGEELQAQHVCAVHAPDPVALMLRRVADKAAGVIAARAR